LLLKGEGELRLIVIGRRSLVSGLVDVEIYEEIVVALDFGLVKDRTAGRTGKEIR